MLFVNLIGGILIGISFVAGNPSENPENVISNCTTTELVDKDNDLKICERWIHLANGDQTRESKAIFYAERKVLDWSAPTGILTQNCC